MISLRSTLLRFFIQACLPMMAIHVYAQEASIDSLRNAAEKEKNPTIKAETYLKISEQTINADPRTSFEFANKAIAIARAINNQDIIIRAELPVAVYYSKQDRLDSVFYLTRKNIAALAGNKEQQPLLVNFSNLQGNGYMRSNRQKEALERFYFSLRIADSIADPLSQIKCHVNIGFALMELNQFDKAIVEFKKAVQLMVVSDHNVFATTYNNLASCYGSLNQIDSAKKYVNIGIAIAKKTDDLPGEANGLNILGTVYNTTGRFKEALDVFLTAQKIREKIGDPFFIVSDMSTIADLYSKTGQPQKGIDISKQALSIAAQNNLSAKFPMIYQSLANNYEAAGDFAAAADVYKKMNAMKDSMYAKASPEALAEMQTKYETEKKESRIREQEKSIAIEKNRQQILIIGAIVFFILAALLALTQYRRYKWKQEARMRTEIMRQQEMSTKAILEAEEGERQRIAKDLHDGVGQMMSAAKMNLSAYEHEAKFKSEDEKRSFEKIIQLVDDSCKEVRSVSHNMMPNALLKNNLAAAIREFIDKLDQKKLKVHLYTQGIDARLDSNVETVLYRVIQECVNNVIRHADANALDISVVKENGLISATVEDNGKGFSMDGFKDFEGIGLKNIRTRVEYLKGTVEFDSKPGHGTLVVLHVPI